MHPVCLYPVSFKSEEEKYYTPQKFRASNVFGVMVGCHSQCSWEVRNLAQGQNKLPKASQ